MTKTILCIQAILLSIQLSAQEKDSENILIDPIEISAEFPGGYDSLYCFFESLVDIEILNSKDIKGKLITTFEIDSVGNVSQIIANPEYTLNLNGIITDSVIEKEIKRTLELMPNWIPATLGGRNVRTQQTFIVRIPYVDFKCNRIKK